MAGKRAGLKHSANGDDETTRSGLFMEAVRIIKEMRRATNGEYPKYAIWENVMGAFSSNSGEDFRVVLEELVKICEPEAPPVPSPGKAGWPYADCIMGDGWSLAWRVFDAQYWGVAQRRRRVYLVLDLTGGCAEKVLFERPGLRGHSQESGTPWKGAAGCVGKGAEADDPESGCVVYDSHPQDSRIKECKGVAPTVAAKYAKGTADTPLVCVATQQGGAEISEDGVCPTITAAAGMSGNNQPWICCENAAYGIQRQLSGVEVQEEVAPTILAAAGESGNNKPLVAYGISSYDSNAMKSGNPHSGIYESDTSRTLDLNGGNPACNQGGIVIVDQIGGQGEYYQESDVSSTLRAGGLGAICYDARGNGEGDIAPTITGDHNNRVTDYTALCMTTGSYMQVTEEVSPTLMARDYKDPNCVCSEYIVRRLTPTECARLQGFPDRWGDIPQKDTLTDEEYSFWLNVRNTHAAINGRSTKEYTKEQLLKWYNKLHSDSSEYKMWGNGIALPNALYVMQGIADAIQQKEK